MADRSARAPSTYIEQNLKKIFFHYGHFFFKGLIYGPFLRLWSRLLILPFKKGFAFFFMVPPFFYPQKKGKKGNDNLIFNICFDKNNGSIKKIFDTKIYQILIIFTVLKLKNKYFLVQFLPFFNKNLSIF